MIYGAGSPILGEGIANSDSIDAWFREQGPFLASVYAPDHTYREPPPIGLIIVALCQAAGVNSDLVAAQILKESAAWQSAIVRDKNNPSGLGAVNDNAYGGAIPFTTPREGIRATVAHLLTYVLGRDNPWWQHDPRAAAVPTRNLGIVRVLADLNGRWAVPGVGYGEGIANLANKLVTFSQQRQEAATMPYPFIRGLIDIRSQLATNPNAGPSYGIPLAQKAGVIVHYSGPPVDLSRSDLDIIKGEAAYHVNKNWGTPGGPHVAGDGYMYHITIGRNGEKWLTRNLEACLWHCGSWPENETWWAAHVPIGDGQRATPAQLAALEEVVSDLLASNGLGRERVKGHQEVYATACPGSLMDDFVRPYRNRRDAPVPQPAQPSEFVAPNGKKITGGFLAFWHSLDADQLNYRMLGLPMTDEFVAQVKGQQQPFTYQVFERGVLTWRGGEPHPWDITATLDDESQAVRRYAKEHGLFV